MAVVGMDGRRGEKRVGKMPRENEIGGRIPRGQSSHFIPFFFFADASFPCPAFFLSVRYVSPTLAVGVRTLPKLDPSSARGDEGEGKPTICEKYISWREIPGANVFRHLSVLHIQRKVERPVCRLLRTVR